MILIPVFLLLFAGWMLWGWCVGESKNIKWLRHWCGTIFVMTVALMSAGAGAIGARVLTKESIRGEVSSLLDAIDSQIAAGNASRVQQQLARRNPGDDPDSEEFDLLDHLGEITSGIDPTKVASTESPRVAY